MCTITINPNLIVTSSGGVITSIIINGTVIDCSGQVLVTINCSPAGQPQTPVSKIANVTAGLWEVEFTAPELEKAFCDCGKLIQVLAECDSVPGCQAVFMSTSPLECEAECPIVTWVSFDIGSTCMNGTRPVTINASVTPQGSCSAELRDSNNNLLAANTGNVPFILSGTNNYNGGQVTFSVIILTPANCTGLSLPINIPECPPVCPNISFMPQIGEDCDENGNKFVDLTAILNSPQNYQAELRDANNQLLDSVSGSGQQILSFNNEPYPAGTNQQFKVIIISPSGCGEDSITIPIPPCEECPDVNFVFDLGNCREENGNSVRQVTVTAELNGQGIYTAELRDGNNTLLDSVSGSGVQSLTHAEDYPIGSTQTFRVIFTNPESCSDKVGIIEIADCSNPPPDEGGGCLALRIVMVVLGAFTIVAWALALCVPAAAVALFWIGVGLAIGALIAGIIWWIFCPKPCNWGLLLSGQITLGGGLLMASLSNCCNWMLLVGILLTLTGIGLLIAWKVSCNYSNCRLAKEIVYVGSTVVIPIIANIVSIPVLGGCVNNVVNGIITAIMAILTVYAVSCSETVNQSNQNNQANA